MVRVVGVRSKFLVWMLLFLAFSALDALAQR
jgi:hypothetical protein